MESLFTKNKPVYCSDQLLDDLNLTFYFSNRDYLLTDYLSDDINILTRRNALFSDVDKIPGCKQLLDDTIVLLDYIYEITKIKTGVSDKERDLYSVKQLENYIKIVEELSLFYSEYSGKISSSDLLELLRKAHNIKESDEYRSLCGSVQLLLERVSHIKSVSVGFNLNAALSPHEAGILSVNDAPVESGSLIDRLLQIDNRKDGRLLSLAPLVPVRNSCSDLEYTSLNYAMYSALNKLFSKQIHQWTGEIEGFISGELAFLLDLLPDLKFISTVVNLQRKFSNEGLRMCRPQYLSNECMGFYATGIYNPVIMIKMEDRSAFVKNSFSFDSEGRMFLLTGPNSGGKTVFLQSIGIIQVFAQLGMNVPADHAAISPASSIVVHFPGYNASEDKGRLEDECSKIQDIFSRISSNCFFLMDETFSSTDSDEAVDLATDILKAFSALSARGIFATHFHRLRDKIPEINTDPECKSAIDYLVSQMDESGSRTYKIKRTQVDMQSDAKSISEKYGVNYSSLIRLAKRAE